MTIFSFPSIIPASSSFELVTNTKTFRSPLTNSVQTASRKGSLWKVGMSFNNLHGSQRAEMQAFLTKLNGQEHRFALYDHSYARRGGGNRPVERQWSQPRWEQPCLRHCRLFNHGFISKPVAYISFNNELHMVTDDANSDGAGAITPQNSAADPKANY